MMVSLLGGALVGLSVLVILRPLALRRPSPAPALGSDIEARDRLLRQVLDLDDDLAAGKIDAVDHARSRAPLEREVAEVMRRSPAAARQRRGAADVLEGRRTRAARQPVHAIETQPKGRRRRSWFIGVAAGAVAVLAVGLLLAGSLTPRAPGAVMTGVAPPGTNVGAATPEARAEQLGAVTAAEAEVKRNPRDPAGHLALASAYAAAAAPQLATIEYLAVTRIDRTNPEANAALALVALAAGQPQQGKELVDTALAAHPGYPEALYARGLVQLMGLGDVAAGQRDLAGYLAAAPYGSHRTAVETLLAMIPKGGAK